MSLPSKNICVLRRIVLHCIILYCVVLPAWGIKFIHHNVRSEASGKRVHLRRPFLPRDAYAWCGICYGPVSVTSVCPSVTSRCSVKTVKPNGAQQPWFSDTKDLGEIRMGTIPLLASNCEFITNPCFRMQNAPMYTDTENILPLVDRFPDKFMQFFVAAHERTGAGMGGNGMK